MSDEDSITTWLVQLKAGCSDASGKIWERYVEQLVRLAHRKLGRVPRRAADEEDVVLSAFGGFLNGVKEGRFPRLDDRDDLWQVLVMLTERRAVSLKRRERALKRGGGQVRGESVFATQDGNSHRGLDHVSDSQANPAFAVEVTEQLRYLLNQLSDQAQRVIALGKLEGKTNKELAVQLGISLRSVERKLSIIRDKWSGEYDNE